MNQPCLFPGTLHSVLKAANFYFQATFCLGWARVSCICRSQAHIMVALTCPCRSRSSWRESGNSLSAMPHFELEACTPCSSGVSVGAGAVLFWIAQVGEDTGLETNSTNRRQQQVTHPRVSSSPCSGRVGSPRCWSVQHMALGCFRQAPCWCQERCFPSPGCRSLWKQPRPPAISMYLTWMLG